MANFFKIVLFMVLTYFVEKQVSGIWWLNNPIQLHTVLNNITCANTSSLPDKYRRQICQKYPDVLLRIEGGVQMGIHECQQQFAANRWNCSNSTIESVVMKGNRETAFMHAIASAGVVHAITRACNKGVLLNCSCDSRKRGKNRTYPVEFSWGRCSDNVRYGSALSRLFMDAGEKRIKDARALMNIHNIRAGRLAVKKSMVMRCKCHGPTGSCTMRTCWMTLPNFDRVGEHLRKMYDRAPKVKVNRAGTKLIMARYNRHKRPERSDLVYLASSPDYCRRDPRTGSLGTVGRKCNRTSKGTDSCDLMCCGRGYVTRRVNRIAECDCSLKCKNCSVQVLEHTCR